MSRLVNAAVLRQNDSAMVDNLFTVPESPLQSQEIGVCPTTGRTGVPEKVAHVAPSMIPTESYSALEHLVQSLQVDILGVAAEASDPITVDAIRNAIRRVVDETAGQGAKLRHPVPKKIRPPEPQAYQFLERRLDNLRGFVFQLAENASRDAHLDQVSASLIQKCWQNVFEKPSLLKSVLNSETAMAEANVS